jgi:hypothetical protein
LNVGLLFKIGLRLCMDRSCVGPALPLGQAPSIPARRKGKP